MKIKFYAHASFRLEGDDLSVITDPYTPGPEVSNFDPINEPADIVIMSSAVDRFHSDPSHITDEPTVINAMEIPPEGQMVKGLFIRSFPVQENLNWDYGRDPDDNAMYLFNIGGIRVLHIGDIGNAFADAHLEALADQVDLMFALTGDNSTIGLDDLQMAIDAIQPQVIIPMHYDVPRGKLNILPVTAFTDRHAASDITWVNGSELTITPESLPKKRHIYVLEQCR
ncbi:MAG: MBL fold metallo-hydrolase [Chloroflexota bacterium]